MNNIMTTTALTTTINRTSYFNVTDRQVEHLTRKMSGIQNLYSALGLIHYCKADNIVEYFLNENNLISINGTIETGKVDVNLVRWLESHRHLLVRSPYNDKITNPKGYVFHYEGNIIGVDVNGTVNYIGTMCDATSMYFEDTELDVIDDTVTLIEQYVDSPDQVTETIYDDKDEQYIYTDVLKEWLIENFGFSTSLTLHQTLKFALSVDGITTTIKDDGVIHQCDGKLMDVVGNSTLSNASYDKVVKEMALIDKALYERLATTDLGLSTRNHQVVGDYYYLFNDEVYFVKDGDASFIGIVSPKIEKLFNNK